MKIDHPVLLDSLRKAYSAARSLDMCWSGYWGFFRSRVHRYAFLKK